MANILLRQMHVGLTDAKNEILQDIRDKTSFFHDSFFVPPNVDLTEIERGRYYYVTGLKGSGKTALLRFVAETAKAKKVETSFVLFKTHFTEVERAEFSKTAGFSLVATPQGAKTSSQRMIMQQDFEYLWRLFLHQKFAEIFARPTQTVVQRNADLDRYVELIKLGESAEGTGLVSRLFGSIKDGRIKVAANLKFLKAEFSSKIEGKESSPSARNVSVATVVEAADEALEQLARGAGRAVLFLDELEVSFGSDEQYVRDCRMV